jgi:hypothetical protein
MGDPVFVVSLTNVHSFSGGLFGFGVADPPYVWGFSGGRNELPAGASSSGGGGATSLSCKDCLKYLYRAGMAESQKVKKFERMR